MSAIKRHFEAEIDALSKKSGYSWGFLMDRYSEMIDDDEYDWEQFVAITMEHDW